MTISYFRGKDICLTYNHMYYYGGGALGLKSMTIRIETEIGDRLDHLARETHRTKSYYVREALLTALDDLEDIYLAEKRLEDIRAGRTKTIPLEKVMKKHGL